MAGLFGAAWAVTAGLQWIWKTASSPWLMAIVGLVLIYSMSRVYLLRAVPAWNSWRTNTAFFLSATVLGALGMMLAEPYPKWGIAAGLAMAAEVGLMLTAQSTAFDKANRLRIALLGLGITGTLIATVAPQVIEPWLAIALFIIALTAEVIGRWQFYTKRLPFPMPID